VSVALAAVVACLTLALKTHSLAAGSATCATSCRGSSAPQQQRPTAAVLPQLPVRGAMAAALWRRSVRACTGGMSSARPTRRPLRLGLLVLLALVAVVLLLVRVALVLMLLVLLAWTMGRRRPKQRTRRRQRPHAAPSLPSGPGADLGQSEADTGTATQ
jgi:Flp pilus assembly protein TadB